MAVGSTLNIVYCLCMHLYVYIAVAVRNGTVLFKGGMLRMMQLVLVTVISQHTNRDERGVLRLTQMNYFANISVATHYPDKYAHTHSNMYAYM